MMEFSGQHTAIYVTDSLASVAEVYPNFQPENWTKENPGLVDMLECEFDAEIRGLYSPLERIQLSHFLYKSSALSFSTSYLIRIVGQTDFILGSDHLPENTPEHYAKLAEIVEMRMAAPGLILVHDPLFDPTV